MIFASEDKQSHKTEKMKRKEENNSPCRRERVHNCSDPRVFAERNFSKRDCDTDGYIALVSLRFGDESELIFKAFPGPWKCYFHGPWKAFQLFKSVILY